MNYKRLIIGDIHGHFDTLYQIYVNEDPWEVIILGDYFDNFSNDVEAIKKCFVDLVQLRKDHLVKNKGKFVLLLGNHDFHYLMMGLERYSGYNKGYDLWANAMLKPMWDNGDIQLIDYDEKSKTLYSHAGISNTWLSYNRMGGIDIRLLTDNKLLNLHSLRFTYAGGGDAYGNTKYASPIWIRPFGLNQDMYKDENGVTWTQIVGHTSHKYPVGWYFKKDGTTKISRDFESINKRKQKPLLWDIDCMPNYYIIEKINEQREVQSRLIMNNKYLKNE